MRADPFQFLDPLRLILFVYRQLIVWFRRYAFSESHNKYYWTIKIRPENLSIEADPHYQILRVVSKEEILISRWIR